MKPSIALLMIFGGCATARPRLPSQRKSFEDVVRKAEAAGAATEPPEAAAKLRDAKSEFGYARNGSRDPRARASAAPPQAQDDAELALTIARRHLPGQRRRQGDGQARRETSEAATSVSALVRLVHEPVLV